MSTFLLIAPNLLAIELVIIVCCLLTDWVDALCLDWTPPNGPNAIDCWTVHFTLEGKLCPTSYAQR